MTSDERPPILQAAGITKSYAGVHALKTVSFELLAGEVHALCGCQYWVIGPGSEPSSGQLRSAYTQD